MPRRRATCAQPVIDGARWPRRCSSAVERRADRQAVFVQRLGAVLRLDVLADLLDEVRRDGRVLRRLAARDDRLLLGGFGHLARDVALGGHPLERVVAPAPRRVHVHVRALADVALDDAGDERRFFERQVVDALAEVHLRGGLDAVRAVAPVDLIAVQREDLFLRVPLLDLHRDDRFLDLPLPRPVAGGEADGGGNRLRASCCVSVLPPGVRARRDDVAHQRQHHARDAQPGVVEEPVVLGRDDGVAQDLGNLLVGDDRAALDGEVADDRAVASEHARDGVRRVVVERR